MAKRMSGIELKKIVIRSRFLPDHPEPFRRQMVVNALAQEGVECAPATLDAALFSLLSTGYLIRSAEPESAATFQPFHLWIFARPDRGSDRPGWKTGEKYDLWGEAASTRKPRSKEPR